MSTAKKKSSKIAAKAPAAKAPSAKTPAAKAPAAKAPAAKAPVRKPSVGKAVPARAPLPHKKPPTKAPTPAPTPARRAAPAARPSRSRAARGSAAAPAREVGALGPGRGHLGAKWICFGCGAKFYDLNKPEPLCPKCGANQHHRPKRDTKPPKVVEAPVRPEPVRAPIIDEEEDDGVMIEDEEIDISAGLEDEPEDFVPEEEEEEEEAE